MTMNLYIISILCVLASPRVASGEESCALSEHEQNVICYKAAECISGFCQAAGSADESCERLASSVNGSSPSCSCADVCEFTACNGKKAYVASKSIANAKKYKDCHKNVEIIENPGCGGGNDNKPPPSQDKTPAPGPPNQPTTKPPAHAETPCPNTPSGNQPPKTPSPHENTPKPQPPSPPKTPAPDTTQTTTACPQTTPSTTDSPTTAPTSQTTPCTSQTTPCTSATTASCTSATTACPESSD